MMVTEPLVASSISVNVLCRHLLSFLSCFESIHMIFKFVPKKEYITFKM
jgi:hypothetical protein